MRSLKKNFPIKNETILILKDCWWEILIKMLISICYRGSLLIIPIFWGKAIDMVTDGKMADCYWLVIVTLIITLGYYASACLNQVVYYKLYNRMYKSFSKTIYKSIVNNSLYSLSRFKLGEFSNIVNTDIDIVVKFLADFSIKLVRVLEFFIIFYYFYKINVPIFIMAILFFIVAVATLVVTANKTKQLNQVRKRHLDKKFAITHEVFHTIKEIKGFFVFKSVNERIKNVCSNYLDANAKYDTFSVVVKQIGLAIIEVSRYVVAIYGMYLCSVGKLEIGTILVIYSYYTKITENYDNLGVLMVGLEDFKVSLTRLNKLLEFKSHNEQNNLVVSKDYEGNIKFKNVLYGNKKDPILNDISLTIEQNSIVVITGDPGSGKTGIFDLLMKLNRKHSGQILIDGDPYEKISDVDYYNLVSLVRKEPCFFDLSIKDNLMLVTESFTRVKRICSEIGIHDDIMALRNKYDTQINDSGEKVSKNLKIAIAVARTILKDSKIMMFDEAISVLDTKYKKNIIKMLKDLKKDHTIVIISRDEEVLSLADKIITFDNNKVKKTRLNKEKTLSSN